MKVFKLGYFIGVALLSLNITISAEVLKNNLPPDCDVSGLAESNVLAVSWQPAFCEMKSQKKECSVTNTNAYQANNFALHGFWPNKSSCGHSYGYCDKNNPKEKGHCNYKPVPMSQESLANLGVYMPSAAHGTCLQRHEWYKHGTCQTQRDATQYYDMSIRLLKEFNESGISGYMAQNIGKSVSTKEFFSVVDKSLGEGAHKKMLIKCYKGMLIDIYISLPKDISKESTLKQLLREVDNNHNNGCGKTFKVDAIGQN
ncbi:MAG: hypothetical protein COB67_02510 [SAR324 cluster bacterium]|uniref:Uncharacterized protein n=1 Tax=SAR324 cluster bacterium TaxID=2024889 RepID=A0A2A4TB19_9DELT|nr:MAG: hypothetical protein COB67_02510 [SAR324 cluster bacterium]